MKKRLAIAVMVVASAAWAADAPKPAAELDQLKPFVKNWTCTGTAALPQPTGAPVTVKYSSKVTGKWDLGNHWASFKYDRDKTKEAPAFSGYAFWSYDAAQKRFVFMGPDSWGGYLNLTAAAPANDKIEWQGNAYAFGTSMPVKFTVAVDQKAKKLHMTIEGAGGLKLLDDDCK